ncbi:uncharacterized protein LOC101223105 isoform X2 [Cucumis sativus]|uniref:DUF3685 domain-containing protein n=1 Tax=Cucumis sativus TaxID=3659 RepID=A0A0A0K4I5_CUCSA|nr:uncharacterized protein LOC101223105 isoform X2 [Cucumis sativus]KGN44585.1 hypothetical protein Csa_016256 [Cucumis sativus]
MAEHVAVTPSPCIKLQIWRAPFKVKSPALCNLRKSSSESYKFIRISTWRSHELIGSCGSNLIVNPAPRKTFREHAYLRSLVNVDGTTASEAIFVDQLLLMTSIFLTYMAGVIPVPKSNQRGNINSQTNSVLDNQTFSGSGMKTDGQINPKHALDVVKGKILDFLDAFERRKSMETDVLEFTECQAKRPLCLNAIGEGPRLRLLWASFQLIEEEVNNISNATIQSMDDLSKIFSEFILKSPRPVCMSWLRNELSVENNDSSKAFLSLMSEKFKAEDNILPGIKKSGKEELFAELMHFLSFGARRDYCYYDHSLYVKHGISILEDLLITFADGIASMYLEFISVDSSFFDEVDNIGLALCTLSTRALQRLRNEVAMNQWLYQNIEAIVSMYEDRFDLCTLSSQPIDLPGSGQVNIDNWWMKYILRRKETLSSQVYYVVIRSFAMPVKRTKELRALRGWRYYFSLLIELSDITMPLIRVVIDKISSGISFFLVCLIGRSLGLIYTGIRQSLRWK